MLDVMVTKVTSYNVLRLISINDSRLELSSTNVAGVYCIYDVPTEPSCVQRPANYDTPWSHIAKIVLLHFNIVIEVN